MSLWVHYYTCTRMLTPIYLLGLLQFSLLQKTAQLIKRKSNNIAWTLLAVRSSHRIIVRKNEWNSNSRAFIK